MLTYLQAAENGKEIVKSHDVAVHCHQPQEPRGTDEQKEQERRPQHRAVKEAQESTCSMKEIGGKLSFSTQVRKNALSFLRAHTDLVRSKCHGFSKKKALEAVLTSCPFPTPLLVLSNVLEYSGKKKKLEKRQFLFKSVSRVIFQQTWLFAKPYCSVLLTLRQRSGR